MVKTAGRMAEVERHPYPDECNLEFQLQVQHYQPCWAKVLH
jgi:hypothetical protein